MIPFRGKSKLVQYMPKKPTRFGIKCWTLADSKNSYVFDLEIYQGKASKVSVDDVIINFMKNYKHSNHIIYMDSFFTSPSLFDKLLKIGVHSIGMVKTNRRGMMKRIDEIKLTNQDSISFQKKDIMFLRWSDKRNINMISTIKCNEQSLVDYYDKENLNLQVKNKPLL